MDAKSKVIGVKNLCVVVSSVFPVSFCVHLMPPTYVLAENSPGIIRLGLTATVSLASPTSTVQKKNSPDCAVSFGFGDTRRRQSSPCWRSGSRRQSPMGQHPPVVMLPRSRSRPSSPYTRVASKASQYY